MKLSEAIRLGSMLRPQAFRTAFDGYGTCAFGAAYEAIGVLQQRNGDETDPAKYWPWLASATLRCPACGYESSVIRAISVHLNDNHRWTREQIADWVETIEAQQEATQPEPVAVEAR